MTNPMHEIAALRLAAIVEWSDDAIISKDLSGVITSWNRAAERIFGFTSAEAVGRHITLIIPEDRRGEEDSIFARIRANEALDHFETIRRRKDGTMIDISLTVSPIRSPEGKVIGASKIARDVTERKRAYAALEDLQRRLLTLVSASSSLLKSPNVEDVQVATIEAADEVLRADACALWRLDTGSSAWRIVRSRGLSDQFAQRLIHTYEGLPARPVPFGDPLIVEDVATSPLLRDELDAHLAERVTSMLVFPLAINAVRSATLVFYWRQSHRFEEVELRTGEALSNIAAAAIATADAYQQAHEANRLKDEFLATLSHELRTPLNAILGYAKMLKMKMLDVEKQAHAVAVIERNTNSLKQIIEDVLDVSSIVAGKLRLHVQPVNLAEVIRHAVATIAPAAEAKAIRLQTVVDPLVPPVSGDPDRLQQVVWNLVSNAVKFTPRGGRVQTRLTRADSHAEIVVSDTGRGVTAEFLPHLFERFRQADSGLTRDQGGVGLGLAIVRELVESHGGSVDASSDGPGAGATFRVKLPLMIDQQGVQSDPAGKFPYRDEKREPAPPPRLDGLSVLAIDDERDAGSLLTEILESAGATAITVTSAAEALRRLERTPLPDVIVADIGMPGMDGLQFIRILRTLPGPASQIPAAALTAYARSEDRITSLVSGFQMHIAKPIDPAELITAVFSLAQRQR